MTNDKAVRVESQPQAAYFARWDGHWLTARGRTPDRDEGRRAGACKPSLPTSVSQRYKRRA